MIRICALAWATLLAPGLAWAQGQPELRPLPSDTPGLLGHLTELLDARDTVSADATPPLEGDDPTEDYRLATERLELIEEALTAARDSLAHRLTVDPAPVFAALVGADPRLVGEAVPLALEHAAHAPSFGEVLLGFAERLEGGELPRSLQEGLVAWAGEPGAKLLAKRAVAGGDAYMLQLALAGGHESVLVWVIKLGAGSKPELTRLACAALRRAQPRPPLGEREHDLERLAARTWIDQVGGQLYEQRGDLQLALIYHLATLVRPTARTDPGWRDELATLAVRHLQPLIEESPSAEAHQAATYGLSPFQGPEALALLEKALDSPHPGSQATAARALGQARHAAAIPALIEALASPDRNVVKAAHEALGLMTRQRLPADPRRWARWWEQQRRD